MGKILKVLHIAAELAPIAKVGGLGDVLGGLTAALIQKKINTTVFLPKYKNLKTASLKNLKIYKKNFKVFESPSKLKATIYSAKLNKLNLYLIKDNDAYFSRENIYGYKDDVSRFLFFCKACLEFLDQSHAEIDILHIHDWHTAFIAPLYKDIYSKKNLKIKKIVLSIHNLRYQGLCKSRDLKILELNPQPYLKEDKLQDPLKPRTFNLLKGGINYADFIIPVSKNYAKEILIKKHSCHLYKTLRKHKKKIKGVINGLDQHFWNPEKDKFLIKNYSSSLSLNELLKIKKESKRLLQNYLKLEQKDVPVICSIGRLVPQKGPELIKHALQEAVKHNCQFILLGSSFNKKINKMFNKLKKDLKNNNNVFLHFEYHEKLAHQIFAASDFIVIPSLFEPCGLTQMIGFNYAVCPIVRKTGGLADTVFDMDDKSISPQKRNGFTFKEFSNKSLDYALKRAIKFWFNNRNQFNQLIHKNMKLDFSWKKSAKTYIDIYKKLIK